MHKTAKDYPERPYLKSTSAIQASENKKAAAVKETAARGFFTFKKSK
jgi:hypothetical protein